MKSLIARLVGLWLLTSCACATPSPVLQDVEALRAIADSTITADIVNLDVRCDYDVQTSGETSWRCRYLRHFGPVPPQRVVLGLHASETVAVGLLTAKGRVLRLDDATLRAAAQAQATATTTATATATATATTPTATPITVDLTTFVNADDTVQLMELVERGSGWFDPAAGFDIEAPLAAPTRRFEVSLVVDTDSGAQLVVHGAQPPITQHLRNGRRTFGFVLENIEARSHEAYRADPRSFVPWWSLRFPHLLSWQPQHRQAAVLVAEATRLTRRPIDVVTCADRRCRLQAAVRSVLDHLQIVAAAGAPTSLGAARNRAAASGPQMAGLIWRALVDLGETPKLAWTSTFPWHPLDPQHPDEDDPNRWLVVVDGDAPGDPPIWIDPLCTGCVVGALLFDVRDRPAIVVDVVADIEGFKELRGANDPRTPVVHAETIRGPPLQPRPFTRRLVDVAIDADGTAVIRVVVKDEGVSMREKNVALWQPARAHRDRELLLEEYAQWLDPRDAANTRRSALTLIDTSTTCDRNGRCTSLYAFKVVGSASSDDDDTMSLPLWGMRVSLDWNLRASARNRRAPLVVYDESEHETVTVRPPPGWHILEAPASFQSTSPICEVAGEAAVKDGALVLQRRFSCNGGYFQAPVAAALDATFTASRLFASSRVTLVRDATATATTATTTAAAPTLDPPTPASTP